MLLTPDFSEVADAISAGTYKVVIKKGDTKEWPNGGMYVNWEMETVGEENPKNNGRRIFYKTPLSGKGAFLIQRFYQAAAGKALAGQFDTEELYGKQVEVEVVDGINRQTGEPTGYTEVKSVKRVSS